MQKFKKSINFFAVIIICFSLIVTASAASELIPIGHTAGIRLASDGVIVIGFSEDLSPNPCKNAGLSKGDIIMSINGTHINSNAELKAKIADCQGKSLKIEYVRNGKTETTDIMPAKNKNGDYVIGVWLRDSIAGIGTVTYYNPETKTYGALGHGISDTDANLLIPIEEGSLMDSKVVGVKKGASGNPGELIGEYDFNNSFANITKNTDSGIYGAVSDAKEFKNMKKYPIAKKDEIKTGKATILTNVDGDKIEEYEIEITSIYSNNEKTKNMLIRAIDPKLIEKTGGIVRGMSGSPILQNGKIVGAVTHV